MARNRRILAGAALILSSAALVTLAGHRPAEAQRQRPTKLLVGDKAVLYQSIDEFEREIEMADMIADRPLVLVTGSAT